MLIGGAKQWQWVEATCAFRLEGWCRENHLLLNVSKTKEVIVDFSRKQQRDFHPLHEVERVDTFKYLGVTISQDLSWTHHLRTIVKKARHLYLLRRLRDFKLSETLSSLPRWQSG